MDKQRLTQKVKSYARELGFTLAGVTNAEQPPHLDVYNRWLAGGLHGEMGYLANERAVQRRADPRAILPECQSILVLAAPYEKPRSRADSPDKGETLGRIAAYAWGEDYHESFKSRLQRLVEFIEEQAGQPVANRWYSDTGPLLERELAQRAGLGWIGKNSMLINPKQGSYFLLAEILLGIELEVDLPIQNDYCGSCTRCIEACPTDCILPNRTLDARRCISYLTIELKGAIPEDLREEMENWVFGCDICQEVCPWNMRFAPAYGDAAFSTGEDVSWVDLKQELGLGPGDFRRKFKGSPVRRAKRRGYLRNTAVALGNTLDEKQVAALKRVLLEEDETLVRGHAAWALGQIGGEEAQAALLAGQRREADSTVLKEIRTALKKLA